MITGKILFIAKYPLNENYHLKTKFNGQMEGLRQLGYDVYYIGFDSSYMYLVHDGTSEKLFRICRKLPHYLNIQFHIDISKAVIKACDMAAFDYVYYRITPYFRSYYKMLRKLKSNRITVICEIPTYYPDGEKHENPLSFARKIFQVYSNLWKEKSRSLVDLYTVLGSINGVKNIYGKPYAHIDNAIDLDSIKMRKPVKDKKIHILALGAMGEWHGFDRLINSSAVYNGNIDYCIHMVGGNNGGCLKKWESLARSLPHPERIIFHGPLYGRELDDMFDLCDIGISSLGAYRINMDSLPSLKLREYMARGLPFVYAVYDQIIDSHPEECKDCKLKIANDDSIPDMKQILEFAACTKRNPDIPFQMRQFAEVYMQWKSQFEKMNIKLDELSVK